LDKKFAGTTRNILYPVNSFREDADQRGFFKTTFSERYCSAPQKTNYLLFLPNVAGKRRRLLQHLIIYFAQMTVTFQGKTKKHAFISRNTTTGIT